VPSKHISLARRSASASAVPITLAMLLFAVAVGLAGCAEREPFAGTWSVDKQASPLAVIVKTGGQYRVTLPLGSSHWRLTFVRNGDVLTTIVRIRHSAPSPYVERRMYSFTLKSNGHLMYREGDAGRPRLQVDLQRVGESTVEPASLKTSASP
jgi:type IV pilus biogenesis protein CpaD/CtpE